ncbi:MAG: hypothetical protein PHT57_00485, partial [Rhodoferax sp.]|nr:hypothetical protein [Rhodoferax sp.]
CRAAWDWVMMRQLKNWISKRCCEFRFNAKAFSRFGTRHVNIKRDEQAFKHRSQRFDVLLTRTLYRNSFISGSWS